MRGRYLACGSTIAPRVSGDRGIQNATGETSGGSSPDRRVGIGAVLPYIESHPPRGRRTAASSRSPRSDAMRIWLKMGSPVTVVDSQSRRGAPGIGIEHVVMRLRAEIISIAVKTAHLRMGQSPASLEVRITRSDFLEMGGPYGTNQGSGVR